MSPMAMIWGTLLVNYDNCTILPTLIDDYFAMVKRITERF